HETLRRDRRGGVTGAALAGDLAAPTRPVRGSLLADGGDRSACCGWRRSQALVVSTPVPQWPAAGAARGLSYVLAGPSSTCRAFPHRGRAGSDGGGEA